MKRIGIFLLFTLLLGSKMSFSQEAVAGIDTTKLYKKIMIVPFEEQMYLCGVQNNLAAESQMTHQQIVRFFRYGISSALQNKFLYLYNTTSLIHMRDTTKDLRRTYASIGYKFEPYKEEPVEEEKKTTGLKGLKFKAKPKRKKISNSGGGGKIKNGQLVSRKSVVPKFAALTIEKDSILSYLSRKYATDLFVFITEMDIENDISDQVALANNKYKRHLRIHYAIVNNDGQFVSKGVVSTTFPNSVNKVKDIKAIYFPILADKLAKKLPNIPKPEPKPLDPLEKITPTK